jgi:pimeloyl-ACP methyl ester carboxylesterase
MECALDKITVFYEVRGEGRPILMLHGLPLDHRHMLDEMEPLFEYRPGWKRLYPDLPGMGQTVGPDWITCQDHVLNVLLDFIDHVIPGQRFVVAGLSYGGYLARGLVYCRGEQIDGVLLNVPAVAMRHSRRILPSRVVLVRDDALLADLESPVRDGINDIVVVQTPWVVDRWKANIFPAVSIAQHEFIEQAGLHGDFSFDAAMAHMIFDRPTLILTGRQDDVCGYREAWDLLDHYPRATFAVLDNAGHCLVMEQQPLFWALANEWLDRVEQGTSS